MSNGNISTQLDRPYAQQPATRAAAVRVISGQKKAEMLLDMLGLVDPEPAPAEDGRKLCTNCGKPLPDPIANGGRKPCRRAACVAAAAAARAENEQP